MCTTRIGGKRTGNPAFSGRVFLIRTPENSAEPGIKTFGVRKKDSLRQQTHPPFPYFRRTHTIIGQWHWFIGNFIYLCNIEITKAFLRGRTYFPAPDVFAFKYCDGPSNLCEVASLLLNSSKSRAVAIFLSLNKNHAIAHPIFLAPSLSRFDEALLQCGTRRQTPGLDNFPGTVKFKNPETVGRHFYQ